MDRVKKLKVKKSDGTFTDYLPLGADALYVDLNDGENVEEAINDIRNKSAKYYDTVADMKNDLDLKVGDTAVTLGYYEVNDGGNGEYKITNNTIDENDSTAHKLNNNLKAELIIDRTLKANQFGCYSNNSTVDDNSINKATRFLGPKVITFESGKTYKTSNYMVIKNPTILDGNNSIIDQDSSATGAIMFDNNTSNSLVQNFNIKSTGTGFNIKDMNIDQTYREMPDMNKVINNKIISTRGCRVRVGINGNTESHDIIAMNNIYTTGNTDAAVGVETWAGDTVVFANAIKKAPEAMGTGSSGITLGKYDGQKAIFNYINGFNYGVETGGNKNLLIFGNTIKNCNTGIRLTTSGKEKDTQIAYNYISIPTDKFGLETGGSETITITNTIFEHIGDTYSGVGINATNNSRKIFIKNCIFRNLQKALVAIPQVEIIIFENCSFIGVGGNDIKGIFNSQAKHFICNNCYFEDCSIVYQHYNADYLGYFMISNCVFKHTDNWDGFEYVLSGAGLTTRGIFRTSGNTYINCKSNPMYPNTITDGVSKRPLLFQEDGLYYCYNIINFSDLLNSLDNIGFSFKPGDIVYDNYTHKQYIVHFNDIHEEFYSASVPTTGTFKRGDKIYNNLTLDTSIEGWICISDGIFGSANEPLFRTFGILA